MPLANLSRSGTVDRVPPRGEAAADVDELRILDFAVDELIATNSIRNYFERVVHARVVHAERLPDVLPHVVAIRHALAASTMAPSRL